MPTLSRGRDKTQHACKQVCLCYHAAALDTADVQTGVQTGVPTPQHDITGTQQAREQVCLSCHLAVAGHVRHAQKVCSCQPMAFLGCGGCERGHARAAACSCTGRVNGSACCTMFLVFRHDRCEHACPQHQHLGALGHGRCTNHQVVVLEHNRCKNRCAPLSCGITGTTP